MFKKSKDNVQEKIDSGLQGLYVFQDSKMFPVFVFVYKNQEQNLVEWLAKNTENIYYKTEDICKWCISHGIEYQIFITMADRIRPLRRYQYWRIVSSLKEQL